MPGPPLTLGGYQIPFTGKPVQGVRDYLDNLDEVPLIGARSVAPRRVLAALGPRMLELAAERTWGAHTYFVPVRHTELARKRMGPDAYLAVEQGVVLASDKERVREIQRAQISGYLQAPHQRANLLRLGFTEDDFADGGSRELRDAIIVGGDLDAIARRVRDHLDAGANHVCLQVLTASDDLPLREWRALAGLVPAL